MSTLLPTPPLAVAGEARPLASRVPGWLREPLLHFVALGALLFALDHFLVARGDDPKAIYVDAVVDDEARRVFKAARGRDPDDDELYALRKVWLDNEVLYREGLALGVDKGDPAIRDRVIFKTLSVVSADLKLPPYDDAVLKAWFEKHRDRYDEPARFDFLEAVLAGDRTESAVRAFVDLLNKGTPGELSAGLRVYRGRPHANIVQGYGEDFARALEALPPGHWAALAGRDGWRAVRLESVVAGKPADFESLRGPIAQDWTDATMAEQRSAAVRALARKYVVRTDSAR